MASQTTRATSLATTQTTTAKKPAKPVKPAKTAEKAIEMEEVEELPEEAAEEDWSVEETMVRKIRATFAKQSEGEEELGVGKAMKVFLKSEVKPKDVGAMWGRGRAET